MPSGPRPVFRVRDVARFSGEERARANAQRAGADWAQVEAAVQQARPLTDKTVTNIIAEARKEGGRWHETPPPMPEYETSGSRQGQQPGWWVDSPAELPALERALREWWHRSH